MAFAKYTAPGLTLDEGKEISEVLQARLHDLNDLHLLLKHAHWNVTGPGFIAVHEMIDPQVDTVREFVDAIAERMATLGATPNGLAGALVAQRTVEDYPVGRARVADHLHALNDVYTRVIEDHPQGYCFRRRGRPHHRGPADWPDRRAGEVPVVHPRIPREQRRRHLRASWR